MVKQVKRDRQIQPHPLQAAKGRVGDCGSLWLISCKLRALGELIKAQNGEPAFEQPDVNYGLGTILIEAADEIDGIRDKLEGRDD